MTDTESSYSGDILPSSCLENNFNSWSIQPFKEKKKQKKQGAFFVFLVDSGDSCGPKRSEYFVSKDGACVWDNFYHQLTFSTPPSRVDLSS